MNKVALVIIYNHKYDKNIEILEKIYGSRFSHIFHLVPFYTGSKSNVIAVYENSYYFQGYIAQGLDRYFADDFTHYFFIGDDLLINPIINENNYHEHLRLGPADSFIPDFISLHESDVYWSRLREAFEYNLSLKGVEAQKEVPAPDEARKKLAGLGLEMKPLSLTQIYKGADLSLKTLLSPARIYQYCLWLLNKMRYLFHPKDFHLSYPMVGAYSDIFAVSGKTIKQFCHYCGVFAATELFVELALPTALALSSEKIVNASDLQLRGKPLWSETDLKELDQFEFSLKKLLSSFPSTYLYLHPVKLSKWKIDI